MWKQGKFFLLVYFDNWFDFVFRFVQELIWLDFEVTLSRVGVIVDCFGKVNVKVL